MARIPVYIISTVLFAAFLFLPQVTLFAQNPPPDGVARIISDIMLMEQHFEQQQWDEAQAVANRIDNELLNVLVETKFDDLTLEKALVGLKAALYEGNLTKTEGKYIFFQKRFFTFLNNFSYEIHPILAMIEQSVITESTAALKNRNYQDIANEMAEAGNLFRDAKPLLLARGISEEELVRFRDRVIAVIKAVKRNEYDQLDEQLQGIQELYSSFMKRAV